MMTSKLFLVLACVALAGARLVRRETADPTPLQEIQKHAAELQKTISEQVNAIVISDNTQAINKALKDGTDSFLQQLSAFSSSLQSAATDANEKTKAVVEKTRQSLQQKVDEVRQQHPDVELSATALKDNYTTLLTHALQETQNLAKEVAKNAEDMNQMLGPKIKDAYDELVRQAQAVQQQVKDAAMQ